MLSSATETSPRSDERMKRSSFDSNAPDGIRTRATALKGPRPGPLVDGGLAAGYAAPMARGYAEGPALEERLEALERGQQLEEVAPDRAAVYGSTDDDAASHFLGWLD